MAKLERKIGLTDVRSLPENAELFDGGRGGVPGFGIRRQRSPSVAYVILYRTAEGRSRRYTIGKHGAPWIPDTAREEAKRILSRVADGKDPGEEKKGLREGATVAELCDRYMQAAKAGRLPTRRGGSKKASTIATDQSRIDSHILPLLGTKKVAGLTTAQLEAFMHDVADGKTHRREKLDKARATRVVRGGMGTASRTVGLLGAIMTYAVKIGLRSDNPAQGVLRPEDGKRERRLSAEEYALLADGLAQAEGTMWPHAVAAARFLVLTGWRSGEAINLTWAQVDLARRTAFLSDSKTGKSRRALSRAACGVLAGQREATGGKADDLVFPPSRGETVMTGFKRYMARVVKLADLPGDVTAHVLRHSFMSVAGDLGMSLPTIAQLAGHKGQTVTERYMHPADAVLLAAADQVANEILNQMGQASQGGAEVIPMAGRRG